MDSTQALYDTPEGETGLDIRIAELEAENERQADALHKIRQWAEAYPAGRFREPTEEEFARAYEKIGAMMADMHGSWARHIVTGIAEIARQGLGEGADHG